jgi:hypothetical protein
MSSSITTADGGKSLGNGVFSSAFAAGVPAVEKTYVRLSGSGKAANDIDGGESSAARCAPQTLLAANISTTSSAVCMREVI